MKKNHLKIQMRKFLKIQIKFNQKKNPHQTKTKKIKLKSEKKLICLNKTNTNLFQTQIQFNKKMKTTLK